RGPATGAPDQAQPGREAATMRTESFPTPGRLRLDIRLGAGEIRLASGQAGETIVTLEPLRDNEDSRAAVEDARVDLRERADGHEVLVDVRARGLRGAEVLGGIGCPAATGVKARSGARDIAGAGRVGWAAAAGGSRRRD